ncbi:MAG: hypothetical protein HZB28_07695 [Methylocystis sp.]|nr:hypothetical protein [Methylocystis sp.]
MAKNDQQEAYEKLLSAALSRAVDFVKFAETKNAALLTFSSAWILAGVNLSSASPSQEWRSIFGIVVPIFAVSAITAIASFLPELKLEKFHQDPEQKKSLLFFRDVATFSASAFRDRVRERYFPPDDQSAAQNYLDDLSVQIHVNSCIAVRKFKFFRAGAWIALLGIAVLLTPLLTKLFSCAAVALATALKS